MELISDVYCSKIIVASRKSHSVSTFGKNSPMQEVNTPDTSAKKQLVAA